MSDALLWVLGGVAATTVVCALLAGLAPSLASALTTRALRFLAGMRTASIRVGTDTWHYLHAGPRDAPVLLLVHGFAADKDTWLTYARQLGRECRVIAPDVPGFGDATSVGLQGEHAGDYTPRIQAHRLLAFCDALGVDRFHAAGSSMGGYIGLWLALQAPERTLSLALLNPAGVSGARPSEVQLAVERGESPLMPSDRAGLKQIIGMLSERPLYVPWYMLRHLFDRYQQFGELWQTIFDQLVAAQRDDRMVERLPEIKTPTLVVWGDRDRVIDVSCVEVYASGMGPLETLVLPDVGHIPMYEAVAPTVAAHAALMRRVADSS